MPPLRVESEDEEDVDDSDPDGGRRCACMTFALLYFILLIRYPATIAAMCNSISALKNHKEKLKKNNGSTSTPATASKAKETKATAKKKSAKKRA